ncbi:MAG TPA: hypothetical protein VFK57_09225 [Vicinamibacterales bacterium]|nr:hypothetical protein [Vicinamibacterales bacterium]
MADQDIPTRSSNMEKAEGDRDDAPAPRPETNYTERGRTGITNRPLDEEVENQKDVPERGESKPGAHAG